jgi:hypothetical protein
LPGRCFGDIEPPLVRREGEAVGSVEVAGHQYELAAVGGIAVESGRLFRDLPTTLVVGGDPVDRIGEPDTAVRLHDHVVGRIEPLAVVV